MRRLALVLVLAIGLGGCYHVTVNTGITPGTQQIHQPWAKSFVYGLVPPETVEAMEQCGSAGVARVESQITFLNGLVSVLTLSIFTPMDILVTCGNSSMEDLQVVKDRAGFEAALESGQPFLVPVTP